MVEPTRENYGFDPSPNETFVLFIDDLWSFPLAKCMIYYNYYLAYTVLWLPKAHSW